MHGFFLFAPLLLLFGFIKIMFVVLLIVFIVRLATHGRRHGAYGYGYGHGYGHGHGPASYHGHGGHDVSNMDPRRIAAWRFASGQIDRAEFDRIIGGLDASEPTAPTAPPSAPTPQA